MNKRGSINFLAFYIVFLVLMLFIFFRPDNLTGYVVGYGYGVGTADKFYAGQIINGSVDINVDPGDIISKDTTYGLTLVPESSSGEEDYIDGVFLDADEVFGNIFKLTPVSEGYKFNSRKNYKLNLGNFSLSHNELGNYYLNFIVDTEQKTIKTITLIKAEDTINAVYFAALDDESFVLEEAVPTDSFAAGDSLLCVVDFLGSSQLNILIYGPGDIIGGKPTALFEDVFNIADDETIICEGSECGVIYLANETRQGKWGCAAELGGQKKFSVPITMSVNAPKLQQDIPDLVLDVSGEFIEPGGLDLNDYFIDPQDLELEYKIIGAKYIGVSVDDNGIVNFTNPDNFEGTEKILIRAFNGMRGNVSNEVKIKVGTGSNIPEGATDCFPVWDCGAYGQCVNGQQSRVCTDTNSCGVDTKKPNERQSCIDTGAGGLGLGTGKGRVPTQNIFVGGVSKGLKIFLITFAALVFLGIVGFVIYWFAIRKKPEKKDFKEIKINTKQDNVNLNEMIKYAEQMLSQKQTDKQIRSDLINAGWNKDDVNNTLDSLVLKKYVNTKLKSGFNKEQIKKSLLDKKWNKELVEKVINELK